MSHGISMTRTTNLLLGDCQVRPGAQCQPAGSLCARFLLQPSVLTYLYQALTLGRLGYSIGMCIRRENPVRDL